MRSSISSFALLVVILALAGCGSKQKEKDYRSEANAICAKARKELEKIPKPSSLKEVAGNAKHEIAIREKVLADLGELPPPKNIEGGVTEVYAGLEARQERSHAIEEAAKKKDRKKLREIRKKDKEELKLESGRAVDFGLNDCAEL